MMTSSHDCREQISLDATMTVEDSVPTNYLVISNISKGNNVKALFGIAIAHNFSVIAVGKMNELIDRIYLHDIFKWTSFNTLEEAKRFLESKSIPLLGIEIHESAKSVIDNPFVDDRMGHNPNRTCSIAVMPGNEGTGLNERQKHLSDWLVYIPQYGDGTASLNVYIATTLVMNQYSQWLDSRKTALCDYSSTTERIGYGQKHGSQRNEAIEKISNKI